MWVLFAEKEELSKFWFFDALQGLKRLSKFTDTELAPFQQKFKILRSYMKLVFKLV